MSFGVGKSSWMLGAALSVVVGITSVADAQNEPNRRAQMFDTLLKSLIDSQLSDTSVQPPEPQRIVPGVSNTLPPGTVQMAPQLREVRQLSQGLAQELSRLFAAINQDMRQTSTLSAHFNSLLKVNAHAAVLARRSELSVDMAALKPEFSDFDLEWQNLEYQLQNSFGLSAASKTSIQNVNNFNQRLSRLFGVDSQIDTQKFQRLTEALEVGMQNLMDEISTELGWSSETRQLLLMGRIVEQQVRYMAFNQDLQNNREQAVAEYKKFKQLWSPYASQLWPLKNRFIERALQRIEQIDREMNEVLLLPIALDYGQLARLSGVLTANSEKLFETTSLADLIKLDNPTATMQTAKNFSLATTRLTQSVEQNRDLNRLQSDFKSVEQQWRTISTSFQSSTKPEILRLVRTTDQTIESLQEGMQIRSSFDRNKALQLIASLENYGKHLQEDYSNYVVQGGRYERGFAYQGLHTCHQFTAFANNIHQSLADGTPPEELRDRCDILSRGWNYLNNEYLLKLKGAEREQLGRLSSEITPQIVQLQAMFEF